MPPEGHALLFDTYGTVVDWRSVVLEASIMDRVNRGEVPWMT